MGCFFLSEFTRRELYVRSLYAKCSQSVPRQWSDEILQIWQQNHCEGKSDIQEFWLALNTTLDNYELKQQTLLHLSELHI